MVFQPERFQRCEQKLFALTERVVSGLKDSGRTVIADGAFAGNAISRQQL